jgi:serine/threonine-protein kinase
MEKKYYTFSVPVREFWRKYLPVALAVMVIAGIAGVILVDVVIMPNVAGVNRGMVEVPDVAGMLLEDGREKLYAAGLLTEIEGRDFDPRVPENKIISQNPKTGADVKKGRRVQVVVSRGKELAAVPGVKGMTEHQARMELKKNGFAVGAIKKVYDDILPGDQALGTVPGAGTTISREMKVELLMSRGPRPVSAEMPTIVGESFAGATKKVEDAGLVVGKIIYKDEPSLQPGTVVAQSVSPGTVVPLGTPVSITVSVIE